MIVRPAHASDAASVTAIYAPFVLNSAVSLEEVAPSAAEMAERIAAGGALHPWLVAEEGDEVVGYASASRFRPRPGYRFTVETSVYVAPAAQGRGVARALYGRLFELLIRQGFTEAIAAITLPNEASVRLHEAFGFQRAGVYRRVGRKLGRWWDVGLWQRSLAVVSDPPAEPIAFAAFIDAPAAGAPPSRSDR